MQAESQPTNGPSVNHKRAALLSKTFPVTVFVILMVAITILLIRLGTIVGGTCDHIEYTLNLPEELKNVQLQLLGDAYVVTKPSHEGCGKGLGGVSRVMESAWAMRIPGGGTDYYESIGRSVEKYAGDSKFTIKEAVLEVASCSPIVLDSCSRIVFLRLEDVHGIQYEAFTGWLPSDTGRIREGELIFTYISSGGTQERLTSTYFNNLASRQ